jgi:hypothetical protein
LNDIVHAAHLQGTHKSKARDIVAEDILDRKRCPVSAWRNHRRAARSVVWRGRMFLRNAKLAASFFQMRDLKQGPDREAALARPHLSCLNEIRLIARG